MPALWLICGQTVPNWQMIGQKNGCVTTKLKPNLETAVRLARAKEKLKIKPVIAMSF